MYRILMCCFCPHIYNEIHHGFIEAGCEVRDMFIGDEYKDKTDILKQQLIKEIDSFKPDIVFSYGWWKIGINMGEFLNTIKQKGVFRIWWAYDDPVCFHDSSLPVALKSDLVLTTVEECIPDYQKKGVRAYLMPHGCSPHHKRVAPREELAHDLVLLANNYNIKVKDFIGNPFRLKGVNDILRPLVENDFDVGVWGRWWTQTDRAFILPEKFYAGVLPAEEAPGVYSACKIALGLQQVENSKTHLANRTYEILGCGCFHICQYSKALEHCFKKGVHLEWSQSPEETLELVKHYLAKDDERQKIALRGQREVYEKHMLVHRAKAALNEIKKHVRPRK